MLLCILLAMPGILLSGTRSVYPSWELECVPDFLLSPYGGLLGISNAAHPNISQQSCNISFVSPGLRLLQPLACRRSTPWANMIERLMLRAADATASGGDPYAAVNPELIVGPIVCSFTPPSPATDVEPFCSSESVYHS